LILIKKVSSGKKTETKNLQLSNFYEKANEQFSMLTAIFKRS